MRRGEHPRLWAVVSVIGLVVAAAAWSQSAAPVPVGLEPDEALEKLVTQPEVRMELAACEPDVIDPVAIRFDSHGRMWVVEMRDYPLPPTDAPPAGRIRVLEDNDRDGRYETSTTFAEQLLFPTGVQPWKNGAIVTLAGKICFLADDDGDLRSDRQEVWFSGFAEENEQLRANHPTLAPDGLVYVASGLRGGAIVSQDDRWKREQPLKLSGVDFAFDPNGGFFGAVTGNSQFGLTIDDFGNRIGCSNRNPAIQAILPLDFVSAVATIPPQDALHNASAVGPDSEVRAIAQAWTTSNLHAGQFSAACGVLRGCGPGMPAAWADDLFVCEPTAYVVQRQQTRRVGPLLEATRVPGDECIASLDEWFRPVDLAHGPDGCIYVVDMMRAVIEHPQWMPEELKTRADMRWGDTRGRIWRLTASGASRHTPQPDAELESVQLSWVSHANPWHRAIASQWLYEQPADAARIAEVKSLALDPATSAPGVARAVQWLNKQDAWDDSIAAALLQATDPRLRELAIQLRGSDLPADRLKALAADADAGVRFRVAVTLASGTQWDASRAQALTSLARRDGADGWFVKVLAAAPPEQVAAVLSGLLRNNDSADDAALPMSSWFALARRAGQADDEKLEPILAAVTGDDPRLLAILNGWAPSAAALSPQSQAVLAAATERAQAVALDRDESLEMRRIGVEILARQPSHVPALRPLLDASEQPALQVAALPLLLRHDREWALEWLDASLKQLAPAVRESAIAALLSDTASVHWLLDRLESGAVTMPLVGLGAIDRIKRSGDSDIRERAARVFQATSENRGNILTRYQDALTGPADAARGQAVFRQHCAVCHRIDPIGTDVGPDISDSRTKTAAALMTAILDPNAAIDAAFLRYTVLTVDGNVHDGLLLSDSGGTIVLQVQGGERLTLERDQIETVSTSGVSLMPEGFEQLITVDQMRDLLHYLKNWRYLDGAIPLGSHHR